MKRLGWWTIALLSLCVCLYAVYVYGVLPFGALVHPDMREAFQARALPLKLHIFGAAFALALGSLQVAPAIRARFPRFHRWAGRLYLGVGVGVGGTSGLYVAFHAFGGAVAQSGFALLAIAWLLTGAKAYAAIRAGQVEAHRRWMVRNWALTLAAVTLRIYLPSAMIAGIDYAAAYAAIAWLCWVPNLVAAEAYLRRRDSTRNSTIPIQPNSSVLSTIV